MEQYSTWIGSGNIRDYFDLTEPADFLVGSFFVSSLPTLRKETLLCQKRKVSLLSLKVHQSRP